MEATVTDLRAQVDAAHQRLKDDIPPLEAVPAVAGTWLR